MFPRVCGKFIAVHPKTDYREGAAQLASPLNLIIFIMFVWGMRVFTLAIYRSHDWKLTQPELYNFTCIVSMVMLGNTGMYILQCM